MHQGLQAILHVTMVVARTTHARAIYHDNYISVGLIEVYCICTECHVVYIAS